MKWVEIGLKWGHEMGLKWGMKQGCYGRHKVFLFPVNSENSEMKVIANQFLFIFPERLAQNPRTPGNRRSDSCRASYMPNLTS